jgi:hypothetical protein
LYEINGFLGVYSEKNGPLSPYIAPVVDPDIDPMNIDPIMTADRVIIFDHDGEVIFNQLVIVRRKRAYDLRLKYTIIPFLNFSDTKLWLEAIHNNYKAIVVRSRTI